MSSCPKRGRSTSRARLMVPTVGRTRRYRGRRHQYELSTINSEVSVRPLRAQDSARAASADPRLRSRDASQRHDAQHDGTKRQAPGDSRTSTDDLRVVRSQTPVVAVGRNALECLRNHKHCAILPASSCSRLVTRYHVISDRYVNVRSTSGGGISCRGVASLGSPRRIRAALRSVGVGPRGSARLW